MAGAILDKDIEDNKENPDYRVISPDEFLKSLGSTMSYAEVQKDIASMIGAADVPLYSGTSGMSSVDSAVYNNSTHNVKVEAPTINVYDATDPNKVAKIINKEINNWLKSAIIQTGK